MERREGKTRHWGAASRNSSAATDRKSLDRGPVGPYILGWNSQADALPAACGRGGFAARGFSTVRPFVGPEAGRRLLQGWRMANNNGPELAVIGGHRAYDMIKKEVFPSERLGRIDTPYGASEPIFHVRKDNLQFYFMSRHGETAYQATPTCVNYRANIYALKDLDVRNVLSWSAAGAVNLKYLVGQFVIVDDLIDETKNRESTFFRFRGLGMIRQNPVFCETQRNALRSILVKMGANFADKGTYVVTEGPRLETPAEVRKFAAYGADLVGGTLAPELFLAKELEMCYAAICYVANYAEGVKEREFAAGKFMDGLVTRKEMRKAETAFSALPKIILRFAARLPREAVVCQCQQSMRRDKSLGIIGESWREWFRP